MGLKIHPAETKILSNQSSNSRKDIVIDNIKVEILTRNESTKYLGQMITFLHQETTEIKNRIRAAWATFNKYKFKILSPSSQTSIVRRSGHPNDMALTKDHESMIQSTQRKMLRLIIQTKRKYKKDPKQRRRKSD